MTRPPSDSTLTPPAPSPPLALRLELLAGAGLATPTPSRVSLLFAADLALFLGARFRVGLLGAFSLGGPTTIVDDAGRTRGTLDSQALSLLPHAMACLDTSLIACAGVRAGVRLAIGSASGPFVFQTRTGFAPSVSAGPALHLGVPFGAFVVTIDPTLAFNSPSRLGVDGLPTTRETPVVELLVHLGLGGRTR